MTHPAASPSCPEGQPVGRVIAMPADTNPEGDIFGGWLLAHMDLCGATPAFERAQGRCATISNCCRPPTNQRGPFERSKPM